MALSVNPVVWFEIPVVDLGRAKAFYESAFGVELTRMEMGESVMESFPMEPEASGATGALIQCPGYTPSLTGSVVYLQVSSIDETLAAIESAGGKLILPRTSIGPHGFVAHFEDTEGNRVALHEAPAA